MYIKTINQYKQFFKDACKRAVTAFHNLTKEYVKTYKQLEDDADNLKVDQYNVYDEYFEANFTKHIDELEESISLLKEYFEDICESSSSKMDSTLTEKDDYDVIKSSYNEHLKIYNSLLNNLNDINLDNLNINENSQYSDIFNNIDKKLIQDIFVQYHFLKYLLILISNKINKDFDIFNNEKDINQGLIDEEIRLRNKLITDIKNTGNEIFRNKSFLTDAKDFANELDLELNSIGPIRDCTRLTNIDFKICDNDKELYLLKKFLPEIGNKISNSGHILIPFTVNMSVIGNIFYINTIDSHVLYKPFIDSLLVHYLFGYPLNKIHLHLFDGDNIMSFSRYIPLKAKLAELDICRDKKIMNLHLNDIRNLRFAQEDFLVEKGYASISEYNQAHPDNLMDIHITVIIGFHTNIDKKTLDESTELLFFSNKYGMFSIIQFNESAFYGNKQEVFESLKSYIKADSYVFYSKHNSIHSSFFDNAFINYNDGYDLDKLIEYSKEVK